MEAEKYTVTPIPHLKSPISVNRVMLLVLIALAPAGIKSVIFFGAQALLVMAASIISCMAFEALYQKITKQEITVNDYSAAITGLLLAFNVPVTTPLWMIIVGSFVAIIVAKQLFGGLGQNFINPALAGRAFLMAAYMPHMAGGFTYPTTNLFGVDVIASATPLALAADGFITDPLTMLIGNHPGTIGETSAIALIIGGIFLIYKKVITWHVPVVYIGTVFVLTFIFTGNFDLTVFHLLAGGLMLAAFFMATDYSSSPITPKGKIIMGLGCGFITVLIRLYGGYPEGASYAILLMNLFVPLIDKYTKPRVFGTSKKKQGA